MFHMRTVPADKAVPFTLDKPRTLVFGPRALFRMGSLDRPFEIKDLQSKQRGYAALLTWIWACIDRDDAETLADAMGRYPLETPEDLADFIPMNRIGEATDALVKAFELASSPAPAATSEMPAGVQKPRKQPKAEAAAK